MEGSNITYRDWVMAIYLMGTSLKGVSSTKLANDLNIQQRSAWFLAHRIRKAWANNASELFGQVVEIDEAYLGGLEKNKHKDKKIKKGRGPVGKEAVVAIKQRGGEEGKGSAGEKHRRSDASLDSHEERGTRNYGLQRRPQKLSRSEKAWIQARGHPSLFRGVRERRSTYKRRGVLLGVVKEGILWSLSQNVR